MHVYLEIRLSLTDYRHPSYLRDGSGRKHVAITTSAKVDVLQAFNYISILKKTSIRSTSHNLLFLTHWWTAHYHSQCLSPSLLVEKSWVSGILASPFPNGKNLRKSMIFTTSSQTSASKSFGRSRDFVTNRGLLMLLMLYVPMARLLLCFVVDSCHLIALRNCRLLSIPSRPSRTPHW